MARRRQTLQADRPGAGVDLACWAFLAFEALLNGAAFFVVGYDKRVAVARRPENRRRARGGRTEAQRIPERGLLLLAALGAGPGLALGFGTYRHKTRKVRFLLRFWPATVLGLALVALWLWGLDCLPLVASPAPGPTSQAPMPAPAPRCRAPRP